MKNTRNQRNINICVKLNDFTNFKKIAKAFAYVLLVSSTGLDMCRKQHINKANLMVSKKERIRRGKTLELSRESTSYSIVSDDVNSSVSQTTMHKL